MKALLTKIFASIKNFIFNIEKEAKKIIPIGIKVVNAIKTFSDSEFADVLTELIPGELDNQIKVTLRKILPVILERLRAWDGIVNIPDQNEKLRLIIEQFNQLTKPERDDIKLRIASEISTELSGGKLTLPDSQILTLAYYHHPEIVDEKAS